MRNFRLLFTPILLAALIAAPAIAQSTERTIKLIVPWPAGGDTDIVFRALAPLMQKHLGQNVVVANITGEASGTVGAREAKNAPPDGYTVKLLIPTSVLSSQLVR